MTETAFETVRFEATNYDSHCSSLTCDACGSLNKALAELEQQVERARVVGVLDAWARLNGYYRIAQMRLPADGSWQLYLVREGVVHGSPPRTWSFVAPTPDAARAAAAKAIEAGEV